MTKRFSILNIFILLATNAHANQSSNILYELDKEIKEIHTRRCPKEQNINDPENVKQTLACLFDIDQHVIKRASNQSDNMKIKEYMQNIFIKNEDELKKILKVHGWVTISKFGKKADHEAWLIVQHSDHDPEFQSSIAFLLENLAKIGETDIKNYAYLYDRTALKYQHLGLKQKYGTQFTVNGNDIALQPYEGTIEELKTRRNEINLEPLERYLNKSKAMYVKYID